MKKLCVMLAMVCVLCLCGCGNFLGIGINGRIPTVLGLHAGTDDLWVVYAAKSDLSEYGIYSYGKEERGEESRLRLNCKPRWQPSTERFWYLAGKSLQEYDPVTDTVTEHPLAREYKQISAVADDTVILQEEAGAIWAYWLQSGEEAALELPTGGILGVSDGCIVLHDSRPDGTRKVICWDYRSGRERWVTDISKQFDRNYSLTVCGDAVYLYYKQVSMIWRADMTDGVFALLKERTAVELIEMGDVLFCAGWASGGGAAFYAIHPDGTEEKLGVLEEQHIYGRYDPLRLAVYDGKLYYALVKEGSIGYCDLRTEEAENAESNTADAAGAA